MDGVALTGVGGVPDRPDPSADSEPPSDADDDEEEEDKEEEDDDDDGAAETSALAPRALVVCSRRWPCPTRLLRNVLREMGETTSTSLLVLSRGEETGGGLLMVCSPSRRAVEQIYFFLKPILKNHTRIRE